MGRVRAGTATVATPLACVAAVSVIAAAVVGCAASGTPGASPTGSSSDSPSPTSSMAPSGAAAGRLPASSARRWMLVELTDDQGTVQNPAPVPTLDLLDGSTARGTDGCNSFSGAIRAESGSGSGDAKSTGTNTSTNTAVTVTRLVSTQRACTATNGIEGRYLSALEAADRLTVVGDRLTLSSADASLTFDIDRMVTVQPVQPNDP